LLTTLPVCARIDSIITDETGERGEGKKKYAVWPSGVEGFFFLKNASEGANRRKKSHRLLGRHFFLWRVINSGSFVAIMMAEMCITLKSDFFSTEKHEKSCSDFIFLTFFCWASATS
jgi:hypothetical protein